MPTETRSRFNKITVPGLFAMAKEEFKRYPETWKEFYAMRTSKRAFEESGYVSGFGYLAEKPEGTPVNYDARIQGPTKKWVHDTWALACRINTVVLGKLRELLGHPNVKTRAISIQAPALPEKVQRLSRKGVQPSGWKRAALLMSDDIVSSCMETCSSLNRAAWA